MMDTIAARTTPPNVSNRQRRSIAEKRRIVEETLIQGASVARVARANGVNANQVFHWRRLYQAGRLGGTAAAVKLLPVTVAAPTSAAAALQPSAVESGAGSIHIKLGHAQIRVEGTPDAGLLRMVLESLRG
jgi:transposase